MEEPPQIYQYSKNYNYPEKAKGMSFFAFVFSSVFYISIFYIFNLSPQILLNNSKFWFFISNTIILIIAADYGTFYFSKENKLTLYDEYALRSQTKNMTSSFVSQYSEITKENVPECENSIVSESEDNIVKNNTKENGLEDDNEVCEEKGVIIEEKTFLRTELDSMEKMEVEEDNKNCILESSDSEYYDENGPEVEEENNEFSNMSDEELNRRVEEFIRRFNRQIRLQGLLEAAESTSEDSV